MRLRLRPVLFGAIIGLLAIGSAVPIATQAQSTGACGIANPAFCDTFDTPFTGGGRTGQLDPSRWSVSRVSSIINPTQGQMMTFVPANAMHCKTPVSGVVPPNDYFMCGVETGESEHFMEAFHDGGNYVTNDAHPLQPFDFAGRTGKVTFDVDAKTAGGHAWWIEFWLTDEPVEVPHDNTIITPPHNGIGFEFSDPCGGAIPAGSDGSPKGGLSVVHISNNYNMFQVVSWQPSNGVSIQTPNCYSAMPDMKNHFEVRVSQNHVEVWATDMGPSGPLKQIGVVNGVNLGFTRGYIHLQHGGYNSEKVCCDVSHDQTYHWDNVGFDGPALPALRSYNVPDSLTGGASYTPPGSVNIAYPAFISQSATGPATETIPNVDLSGAQSASLTFDVKMGGSQFYYKLNGGPQHLMTMPTNNYNGFHNPIVPVDMSELHNGNNTVQFLDLPPSPWYDQITISSISLLVSGSPSQATATPVATSTLAATATSVPPTATSVPATATPVPSTPVPTNTVGPTATPGAQLSQAMGPGDSDQVTCNGTISIVASSSSSMVLSCS